MNAQDKEALAEALLDLHDPIICHEDAHDMAEEYGADNVDAVADAIYEESLAMREAIADALEEYEAIKRDRRDTRWPITQANRPLL